MYPFYIIFIEVLKFHHEDLEFEYFRDYYPKMCLILWEVNKSLPTPFFDEERMKHMEHYATIEVIIVAQIVASIDF